MYYVETLEKIRKIYTFINERLFEAELPQDIVLTIEPDSRKGKVYGWFVYKSYWRRANSDTDRLPQINISSERLSGRWIDIAETVLHECVHLYCALHNTPCRTNYHNIAFKDAALNHGLHVDKQKNGWSRTSLQPETQRLLEDFIAANELGERPAIYKQLPPATNKPKRVQQYCRYSCGDCGETIRTSYPPPRERVFCPFCQRQMKEIPIKRKSNLQ